MGMRALWLIYSEREPVRITRYATFILRTTSVRASARSPYWDLQSGSSVTARELGRRGEQTVWVVLGRDLEQCWEGLLILVNCWADLLRDLRRTFSDASLEGRVMLQTC